MNVRNYVRVGKVSSVNYEQGSVKVIFEDQESVVSQELPLLAFEYKMPSIGEYVLCLFHRSGQGFCLGSYYHQMKKPSVTGIDSYYKDFFGEAYCQYDQKSKTLTISADKIVLSGEVDILGDLKIAGHLRVTGSIIEE